MKLSFRKPSPKETPRPAATPNEGKVDRPRAFEDWIVAYRGQLDQLCNRGPREGAPVDKRKQ